MEVLYRPLDQGLRDKDLYLALAVVLLDLTIQQALVAPHADVVVVLGCGWRDGQLLEHDVINLRAAECVSGEGENGEDVVEIWPCWCCGTEFSVSGSVEDL